MGQIRWDDSLETGIGMVDAQHRILVDLINRLEETMGEQALLETAVSILHNLRQYTIYHFAAEETLMVRNGYPKLEEHREMHRSFADELEDFEIDALTAASDLGDNLLEFLQKWLVNHIKKEDMSFAATVET